MLVALLIGLLGSEPTGASAAGAAAPDAESGLVRWDWPIPSPHPILRPFIAPATRYAAGHRGIDIAAPGGTPVLAPDDGIVRFVGTVVDRPVVSIEHADGVISSFEPVSSTLVAGEPVARGSPIGVIEPGHCATTCVHIGARLHGDYVSPLLFLGDIRPSVLLPTRPI